jgi:carboxyl-terminal processing protease
VIAPGFRTFVYALLVSYGCHVGSLSIAAQVTQAESASTVTLTAEETYRQGLKLEIERKWASAAEIYDAGAKQWPERTDFRQRLVLCEMHLRLQKRYHDQSFRQILLRMSEIDCARLYSEIIDRIDSSYVDPIDLSGLTRRGIDNLEVALRDPEFQQINAVSANTAQIRQLRDWLRENRSKVLVPDRRRATEVVSTIADTSARTAGVSRQSVYLEFIFGACDALDEFSACLTPSKLEDLYAVIDGNFVGLGVELKDDPRGLILTNVLRGGPAWEAGLKAGEVITNVDGKNLAGMNLDQAAAELQGPEGTSVELVLAGNSQIQRKIRLMRRPVDVDSVVDVRMVDSTAGIGYLKLNGFQKTTSRELETAIEALKSSGMKLLIFDLRGNPGGLLNCSVEIADQFLDNGVIVTTRGRSDGQSQVYRAKSDVAWTFPLVILVDRDSASASEILAGALQENGRADVLGERSFGKGSVQSIFPIRTAPAGLKLTTARFYSPLDRPYTQGVTPNVITRQVARPTNDGQAIASNEDFVLKAAMEHGRNKLGSQTITSTPRSIPTANVSTVPSGVR